eukprot:8411192-Alexandrium_andersonii.AAC.1
MFGPTWTASLEPIPWVVLLICFEHVMGVEVMPRGSLQLADARRGVTVKSALTAFRAAIAELARRRLDPDQRHCLKSVTTAAHSLTKLGFAGALPGCRSWPPMTQNEYN